MTCWVLSLLLFLNIVVFNKWFVKFIFNSIYFINFCPRFSNSHDILLSFMSCSKFYYFSQLKWIKENIQTSFSDFQVYANVWISLKYKNIVGKFMYERNEKWKSFIACKIAILQIINRNIWKHLQTKIWHIIEKSSSLHYI